MTVELTGATLTLDDVVRVARTGETVALSAEAEARMRERRRIVELALSEGTQTYGLTTGVGMRRDASVSPGTYSMTMCATPSASSTS